MSPQDQALAKLSVEQRMHLQSAVRNRQAGEELTKTEARAVDRDIMIKCARKFRQQMGTA